MHITVNSVHPHACGEYAAVKVNHNCAVGSSPRVWGILARADYPDAKIRFIPTRVGNTHAHVHALASCSVHPHACGEYAMAGSRSSASSGSSPRVWGIPPWLTAWMRARRFIPTRVGNTRPWPLPAPATAVHPHACGEYGHPRPDAHRQGGSSPRVWGIPLSRISLIVALRFIPTRVGNTTGKNGVPFFWAVHPHACGEYHMPPLSILSRGGSSPRVWGIQRSCPRWPSRRRFIPTRVGNTFSSFLSLTGTAVHPHACGEYVG